MPTTSPLEIEQRPAGVAGIHGDVGLDERHAAAAADGTRGAADDAGGRGVRETERRADRQHPLAGLELRRIADADDRQIGLRVDLDDGDIGARVGADHLRGKFATVGEAYRDFVGFGDHVRVGEDVAVLAHDEARAVAAQDGFGAARRAVRPRQSKATEEFAQRVVFGHAAFIGRVTAHAADHFDIDDSITVAIDQ